MFIKIGDSTNRISEIASICYANYIDRADNSYDIIVVLNNDTHIRVHCYNKEMREEIMQSVLSQLKDKDLLQLSD